MLVPTARKVLVSTVAPDAAEVDALHLIGVHQEQDGRWKAQISIEYEKKTIGRYDTQREAAEAYDEYAREQGRCIVNFPRNADERRPKARRRTRDT